MKQLRRKAIADAVNQRGELSFQQLKLLFPNVSEMTLRNDLKELDRDRQVVRVHGGVKSISSAVRADDLFFRKACRNIEQKRLIAQKALPFLKPNMSVFLDCGTTMLELARVLPDERFFLVTNSAGCMPELSRLSKPEIRFLGGKLNRFNLSTYDPHNQEEIEKRNFQIAFIAVTGFSAEHGFTCCTEVDDELRKTAIRRADQVIVLMDSSKDGRVYPVTYAQPEDIDALISDGGLSPETTRLFESRGVRVY